MKNSRIRLALVAVVLAAAAFATWYFTRAPLRFVYGVSPISADEAVLLTRHNGDDVARFFVELVRVDGARVWEVELSPFETSERLGHSGVAANATDVFLLGQDDAGIHVLALARADGRERWRTLLAPHMEQHRIAPMMLFDGERILAFHNLPTGPDEAYIETITALSAKDGAVLWPTGDMPRYTGSARFDGSIVAPGRLVLQDLTQADAEGRLNDSGVEIDTTTGERRRLLPLYWGHTITPRGVLGLGLDGLYLIPNDEDGLGEPHLLVPAIHYRYANTQAPCGIYKNTAVVGLAPGLPPDDRPDQRVLVAIDLDTAAIRWTRVFEDRGSFGDFVLDGGVLPRFLPVITVGGSAEGIGRYVTIVDLESGDVVSETQHPSIVTASATADRAFIHDYATHKLIGVDSATGNTLAPLAAPNSLNSEFVNGDMRFGRIWYYFDGWSRPGDLPWTVVDLPSWTVLHKSGVVRK